MGQGEDRVPSIREGSTSVAVAILFAATCGCLLTIALVVGSRTLGLVGGVGLLAGVGAAGVAAVAAARRDEVSWGSALWEGARLSGRLLWDLLP
jgi:hypothetical protein